MQHQTMAPPRSTSAPIVQLPIRARSSEAGRPRPAATAAAAGSVIAGPGPKPTKHANRRAFGQIYDDAARFRDLGVVRPRAGRLLGLCSCWQATARPGPFRPWAIRAPTSLIKVLN